MPSEFVRFFEHAINSESRTALVGHYTTHADANPCDLCTGLATKADGKISHILWWTTDKI